MKTIIKNVFQLKICITLQDCHFCGRKNELLIFGNMEYIAIFIDFLAKVSWRQQKGRAPFYILHYIDKAAILIGKVLTFKSV